MSGDGAGDPERDGSVADSTGGTYTLLVEFAASAEIGVGALGERRFGAGRYAYTGSALGAGGFSRVDRHRRTARGEHSVRHWHVDHLLGHPDARIDRVVRSVGADVECAVAERLPPGPVDGFGASDCDCASHLAAAEAGRTLDEFGARVRDAHEAAVGSAGSVGPGGEAPGDDDATAERAARVDVVDGE
ncbi:DUF123 domain-containing protein [Halorubrum sp. Eb13]|uniref:GIY-YIG nuclease family protein n=1 Tax=Halorubrum sp. Eb13 TaxID=1383843 RepID=UPI000B97EBDB|nr:GIY-YIG nuclease family protein [Halorubrum sp. Eb13]OYR46768.1 hypothetical protein DJ75_05625 [Halorubrum sp. Eb13]